MIIADLSETFYHCYPQVFVNRYSGLSETHVRGKQRIHLHHSYLQPAIQNAGEGLEVSHQAHEFVRSKRDLRGNAKINQIIHKSDNRSCLPDDKLRLLFWSVKCSKPTQVQRSA